MSLSFSGSLLLLDIEGTTSSVSYVYDVMFPFARTHLDGFLAEHSAQPEAQAALALLAQEAGDAVVGADPSAASAYVRQLMDADVKSTGLKELQGLIWESGFLCGEMKAHVYPDVAPALQAWREAGRRVCIYSSGSIKAQRLFFGHSEEGDLLPLLDGHFDTTTGPKRAAESYRKIASTLSVEPKEVLFASDLVAELDAAREAGMQTVLLLRPGNAPVAEANGHPSVRSFEEITLEPASQT